MKRSASQMKALFIFSAVAIFLVVAPSSCFADWGIASLSRERAKELGVEVRSKGAGLNQVHIELEFKPEGELKNISRVDLRFGEGDNPALTAPLEVDRSKPERVAVNLTAGRAHLDKVTLEVWARENYLGGTIYQLPIMEFVEQVKGR